MAIVFDKAMKLLKENGYTSYKIRQQNIIGQATYSKIKNNSGSIDTNTIEKLCNVLNCQPGDLMEYIDDRQEKQDG